MAQVNFTPLQLYYSTTIGAVPTAGNLANGELAVNIADQRLYFKNSSGQVALLADSGTVVASIVSKTSAYTVVAGDRNKIISCNPASAMTLSLTAAATLGAGFMVTVWNLSVNDVTIDPSGSETIDGLSTLILYAGEGLQIICDGSNWLTGVPKASRAYSEKYTSGSARATLTGASQSIAIGSGGSITGTNSFSFGNNTYVFGNSATALGDNAAASRNTSTAIGYYARSDAIGKIAFGNGFLTGSGDSQYAFTILRGRTTNATPKVLTSDGLTAGSLNTVILSIGSAYAFTGTVVARQNVSGGSQSAAWKVEGLIRRESTVASTTLVASTVTAISNAPGWALALSADTTNGALLLTATGAAGVNVMWEATIHASECLNT